MKRLPVTMIEAAFRRMEDIDALQMHPYCEDQKAKEQRAYEVLKRKKLTREEMNAVEDAWSGELPMYFEVGYALGLTDGIATGKAIESAEGAHPDKSEAPSSDLWSRWPEDESLGGDFTFSEGQSVLPKMHRAGEDEPFKRIKCLCENYCGQVTAGGALRVGEGSYIAKKGSGCGELAK